MLKAHKAHAEWIRLLQDIGQYAAQQTDARIGHQDGDGTAQEREKKAFGEQLANETRAPGSQGDANGYFATPAGRAREKKVRDVGAGNEQDKAHGSEHDPELVAKAAHERLTHGDDHGIHVAIRVRKLFFEPFGDGAQIGAGLLERHSVFYAANTSPAMGASPADILERHVERNPQIGVVRTAEPRGHHADDGVRIAIELERFSAGLW